MNTVYWRAYRVRLRNYAATHMSVASLLRWIPVGLGWILVSAMAAPVWLPFLSGPQEEWIAGMQGAFFRLGVLVIMIQSIRMHGVLMRSQERSVLSVHPVAPGAVTLYQTMRCGLGSAWMLPACAILTAPLALSGHVFAWMLMNLGVRGAALTLSAVVFMAP